MVFLHSCDLKRLCSKQCAYTAGYGVPAQLWFEKIMLKTMCLYCRVWCSCTAVIWKDYAQNNVPVLQGMVFLHSCDLGAHGNLRSSNCVITSRWTLQVRNFFIFIKVEIYFFRIVADPGCLSRIRIFSIPDPDPNFFHPGFRIRIFPSRIPRICIKEFKYFNPKKWFLSSRKYDPSCSSRIRILTF